jgi:hypothetical protein
MFGTNLETSQVVLTSTVLNMLAAVLDVESDMYKTRNFQIFLPQKGHRSVASPTVPVAVTA